MNELFSNISSQQAKYQENNQELANKIDKSNQFSEQYKKFGYLTISRTENEKKTCAYCKKSLPKDTKVWRNEFGRLLCTEC